MGPLGVVEVDPLADDPFGLEAVGQVVQVDRLVFERPPEALDDRAAGSAARLSMQRPRPSMEIATPASLSTLVKSALVNWLP